MLKMTSKASKRKKLDFDTKYKIVKLLENIANIYSFTLGSN